MMRKRDGLRSRVLPTPWHIHRHQSLTSCGGDLGYPSRFRSAGMAVAAVPVPKFTSIFLQPSRSSTTCGSPGESLREGKTALRSLPLLQSSSVLSGSHSWRLSRRYFLSRPSSSHIGWHSSGGSILVRSSDPWPLFFLLRGPLQNLHPWETAGRIPYPGSS